MGSVFRREGCKHWRCQLTNEFDKRVEENTHQTTKVGALQYKKKREEEIADRRLHPEKYVAEAKLRPDMPVGEALAELVATLKRTNRAPKTLANVAYYARAALAACGFARLRDLDRDGVERYLLRLDEAGRSQVTAAYYLGLLRQFATFCLDRGWIRDNPIALVKAAEDPRKKYPKRAFRAEELRALIAAAGGTRRALVYRVAALSGLRKNELRLLERQDFTLGDDPRWHPRKEITKSRRDDRVPMLPECAALLDYCRDWEPTRRVLPPMPREVTLNKDLARAGIARVGPDGRRLTFHSFRYAFVTMLALAGVPIQEVKVLARHKTFKETADLYLDLGLEDLAAGVRSLPAALLGPTDELKET